MEHVALPSLKSLLLEDQIHKKHDILLPPLYASNNHMYLEVESELKKILDRAAFDELRKPMVLNRTGCMELSSNEVNKMIRSCNLVPFHTNDNKIIKKGLGSSEKPLHISIEKRRKYICKVCSKGFTTSGHLARHNRIHTGEKNHVCPYPDCNQRFSRHDNCVQHYRIHFKKTLHH